MTSCDPGPRRLRLPAFVTAESIADLLKWAPSIKRQFGEAVARDPELGTGRIGSETNVYDCVLDLLARPGGGRLLYEIMRLADPKGQRGLLQALVRAESRVLGSARPNRLDPADTVRRLLEKDASDLAAWIAFEGLTWFSEPITGSAEIEAYVGLIEEHESVRVALGDYWLDWRLLDKDVAPEHSATSSLDPEAVWTVEVAGLRAALEAEPPLSDALLERLRAALQILEPLPAQAAECRAQDVRALKRLAADLLTRLHMSLLDWPATPEWLERLRGAANSAVIDPETIDALDTAVDWAESRRPEVDEAEAAWQAIEERLRHDDGEEAEDAFRAANFRRRTLRRSIATEAGALTEALVRSPADESFASSPTPDAPSKRVGAPAPDTREVTSLEAAVPRADAEARDPQPEQWAGSPTPTPEPDAEPPPEPAPSVSSPDALSAPEAAAEPVVETPHPLAALAAEAVLKAVQESRLGLAAHLATAAEALGPAGAAAVRVFGGGAVLKALAVGEAMDSARLGAVAARYGELDRGVLEALDGAPGSAPVRLFAFAGAIKPALFLPQTSATEVIRSAEPGRFGPKLRDLAEFVVNTLPKRGGAIDIDALAPATAETAALPDRLRRELIAMAEAAPHKNAIFHRATVISRILFERGPVADAVAALKASRPDALSLAEQAASWIDRDVDQRAYELDRDNRTARDSRLESRALDWLLAELRKAADLLRRWAAAKRQAQGARTTHTDETRRLLCEHLTGALDDLRALLAHSPITGAAATVAIQVLEDVIARMDGRAPAADGLSLDMRLFDNLLLFDPFPAEARANLWTPLAAAAFVSGAPAILAAPPDFKSAFDRLVKQGRFLQAEEAASRLVAAGWVAGPLGAEIEDARDERVDRLRRRSEALRTRVDDLLGADTQGRIDPAASVRLDDLKSRLEIADREGGEALRWLDVPALDGELDALDQGLRDGAALLLEPLQSEIDALAERGKDVSALRDLVRRGDLTALRESVDGMREGAELNPLREADQPLREFASTFLTHAFAALPLRDRNPAEVLADAAARRDGRVIKFSEMTEADAADAHSLLEAWMRLKTAGRDAGEAVRQLMTELRFTDVRIAADRAATGGRRYAVVTHPLSDRSDCPVPAFGSAAAGKLEVVVAELVSVRDGGELHKSVKDAVGPKLFIVKGLLTLAARKTFMVEARRRAAQDSCALVDEATILFLASRSGRRLSDMFAAALPCGGVQPYSDASGKSSPEMFFGRSRELDALWDKDGSCLVFGGRQLGKTALLKQIELRHNRPKRQIVTYGSLQGEAELWPLVANLLGESGVPVKHHSRTGVRTAVTEWLDDDDGRRLVILVDEADTYLEHEMATGYGSLISVRDLMQSTDRRCKFVFAGLHNVQRLARTPNSPLLHFGTPLRIGPLFNQDLGEAREMVIHPMAAAGVVFESAGLPLRVLSAVAYYPSLLQTFGDTLLRRINGQVHNTLRAEVPLPIVVNERQVVDALDDAHFKTSVHEKFEKTLDLDERYRLITLAMLNRSLERRGQGGATPSLSDVDIQALARGWWPRGFEEDGSLAAFQGLLQEMVGLGVLIVVGGDRYAVRSSAIAAMLGGKEQIERKLIELSEAPGPEKLDTGSLRRLDKVGKAPSPLTFRQEGVLLDTARGAPAVHLALGSAALGQDELAASLTDLQGEDLLVQTHRYLTARQYAAMLDGAVESARAGRRNLVVMSGPWLGRTMVDEALAVTARPGSRRPLKVLLAPLTVDWTDADEIDDSGRLWGADVLSLSTLGRGGLRQWLRARTAADAGGAVERLRDLTGGYPLFLSRLGAGADVLVSAEQARAQRFADPLTFTQLGLGD